MQPDCFTRIHGGDEGVVWLAVAAVYLALLQSGADPATNDMQCQCQLGLPGPSWQDRRADAIRDTVANPARARSSAVLASWNGNTFHAP